MSLPAVRIGHTHLKVWLDVLERALGFCRDVLGFEVTQRYGAGSVSFRGRLSSSYRIEQLGERGRFAAAARHEGLYHVAILYPTRVLLADALRRVLAAGIDLEAASDHGVSEAIYLRDPDGNGVELYWDRPPEQWPRTPEGKLAMFTHALDLDALLEEK